MNPSPAAAAPARRARVLRALGLTPWTLRLPASAEATPAGAPSPADAIAAARCALLLPGGCAARELDLLGRALLAAGAELARAPRIMVVDGRPAGALPELPAYLVFGPAQAQALGRELPAAALNAAQIVLVDEPAQLLAGAAGKRRLWTALRQLRRALAGAGG
ncbi:hypothetical protein [Fulvimonas soli]|uniref:Uncharacterized protein n=1 Tax=Fulvimonas soli TaxID=155197 RepID=A0A316HW75_9GAMM|nr:hypothetical protein [Fulvimonas soli]PWK84711.1 hypothetical protein C7456_11012 [Fulvimonas soli]TNY26355.1 hypothetical protein BV497_09210 [Fulvimonas soli]